MAKQQRRQPRRPTRPADVLRSDGALCLTFVNTGAGQRAALESYADLLTWGVDFGALSADSSARLEREAAERPGVATGAFRKSQTLHGRLQRILAALADAEEPAAADLGPFRIELRSAMAARDISADGRRWIWGERDDDLDRVLWPVLLSAAQILTAEDRARVRRCPHEGCGLLFLARGGGSPRKWCSASCRDRTTSRNHYHARVKPRRERLDRESQARQHARLAGFGDSWRPPEPRED